MNEIEILNRVVAYESTHNVEDYMADGWHVWPLLRTAICLQGALSAQPGPAAAAPSWLGKHIMPLRRYLAYLRAVFRTRHSAGCKDEEPSAAHPVDALFLTLSERRVVVDGVSFEIYTDPFVDMLRELGFSSLVWERGEGRRPQYSESVKILSRLNTEMLPSPRSLKEPAWFADYSELAGATIGREVAWAEISPMIEVVTSRAQVFERWLRSTNARILFLVCWYDPVSMSAAMAARRCGIRTVDIQHGAQGKGHFAYSSWSRGPSGGYEVVPDVFWCWGKTTAEELREYNPAFFSGPHGVAGGNLWLNRWRQPARRDGLAIKRADRDPGEKRILVTLGLDVPQQLLEAISASPSGWRWMIRFHPARETKHRVADMGQCLETGHAGLEFERSNELPLYELLSDCDVHVTESSGSALEALAFGVSSVILGGSDLGKTGKFYYRQFIEKKLMASADTASDLIDAINLALPIDQASRGILDLFADNNAAKASLSLLMQNAGFERGSCGHS